MRKFGAAENIADKKEECEEDDEGTVWYFLDKIKNFSILHWLIYKRCTLILKSIKR